MLDFMNLNRTLNELDLFRREFDRLFDTGARGEVADPTEFSEIGREIGARFTDDKEAFVLSVDVPGVKPADVDLQVTRDGITLRVAREVAVPQGYSTHRAERGSWRLSRSWSVPEPVNPELATGEVKDGVLTVTLPKIPEVQPRRIEIAS